MIIIINNFNENEKVKDIQKLIKMPNKIVKSNVSNFVIPDECKGIILSGSPLHVYDNVWSDIIVNVQSIVQGAIQKHIPILGICFGMQIISYLFGGEVSKLKTMLKGKHTIIFDKKHVLFKGLQKAKSNEIVAAFKNEDIVLKAPKGFKVTSYLSDQSIASFYNKKHNIFGTQFHPERMEETHCIIKEFENVCNKGVSNTIPIPIPIPVISNDYKQIIIKNLTDLYNQEKINKNSFKARAYNNVIKELKGYDQPITSINDIDNIRGIGKSIREKIEIILNDPNVSFVSDDNRIAEEISKVYGIGINRALILYKEHGIKKIDDLKNNLNLLNDKQRIGLEYYDDIEKRIPKKEMDKHNDFLNEELKRFPNINWELAGSYRRGTADSGDIDLIISANNVNTLTDIVNILKERKYLQAELALGEKKYMGICKLPRHKTNRRIDILYTDKKTYPFSILYFTGSQRFNIEMRSIALKKGYSLNEYGLKSIIDNSIVNVDFKSEKDIFDFLGMNYVSPEKRN